jgi:HEAT repeat protein
MRLFSRTISIIISLTIISGMNSVLDKVYAAPAKWSKDEIKNGYVVFTHSTLMLLPASYIPNRDDMKQEVSCELAQEEYESIKIGVHSLKKNLKDIKVDVESDLDVKIYHRVTPGLTKEQAGPFVGSMPPEAVLERGNIIEINDSGKSAFFWITFYAGPNTQGGLHKGKIRIKPADGTGTELSLVIRVHPFVLQKPRIAFGMYLNEGSLPAHATTDEATSAIYSDMAAHGQTSVTFYGGGDFAQLPPKGSRMMETSLPLASKAGLTHPNIPCLVLQDNIAILPEDKMMAAAAWLNAECRKNRWPEIIQYGNDEPSYPSPGLRETYSLFRRAPMRLATAMTSIAAYAYSDLHDVWIVHDGDVASGMFPEANRLGAEVWTYSYRLWREGYNPLRQRFFPGFHTWAWKLGGNYIWAYYDDRIHSHVWWRDKNIEPMPMVAWETRRDGIDDYRYMQMLENCISANSGNPTAVEASAWLEALRTRIIGSVPNLVESGKPLAAEEFDMIRAKAAGYIVKLGPVPESKISPRSAPHMKDEAALFRDRSTSECIQGLASTDMSNRRGAAWSLFERGPEAIAALDVLIGLLDDPEVCIPAMRAIENIGPKAYPAIPKISTLLRNPDSFVRLGAAFTLGAMGSPPTQDAVMGLVLGSPPPKESLSAVEPLRLAVADDYPSAAFAVGKALSGFGAAAAPALPEAIKLLNHSDWNYWWSALKIIAAVGPEAAPAVPNLIELYESKKGAAPYEAITLAAIGPAASKAIPVLEKYAGKDSSYAASVCYAHYCIRGDTADLFKMVDILKSNKPDMTEQKPSVISYLAALGVKAAPAADVIRNLIKEDKSLADNKGLALFLERVENKKGPAIILP